MKAEVSGVLIEEFSDGKPENDLGLKMVQVCIKENGPGFQNIEIDRKMV